MKAPTVLPVSFPDTVEDAADGATFYLDPSHAKAWEGQAFLATSDLSAAKDARLVVRLSDGRAFHFPREWRVRVVALDAATSDDQW